VNPNPGFPPTHWPLMEKFGAQFPDIPQQARFLLADLAFKHFNDPETVQQLAVVQALFVRQGSVEDTVSAKELARRNDEQFVEIARLEGELFDLKNARRRWWKRNR